jgi:hypothetical protein
MGAEGIGAEGLSEKMAGIISFSTKCSETPARSGGLNLMISTALKKPRHKTLRLFAQSHTRPAAVHSLFYL